VLALQLNFTRGDPRNSNRSSISRTLVSIMARTRSTEAGVSPASRIKSSPARIGASGFRSSCASMARNSFLRRSVSRSFDSPLWRA
jgi:hypothetical protein